MHGLDGCSLLAHMRTPPHAHLQPLPLYFLSSSKREGAVQASKAVPKSTNMRVSEKTASRPSRPKPSTASERFHSRSRLTTRQARWILPDLFCLKATTITSPRGVQRSASGGDVHGRPVSKIDSKGIGGRANQFVSSFNSRHSASLMRRRRNSSRRSRISGL